MNMLERGKYMKNMYPLVISGYMQIEDLKMGDCKKKGVWIPAIQWIPAVE